MAISLYPVVSLVTTNPQLGRDFLRWLQPYAVVARVFGSGQALLEDPEGTHTQLLVLSPGKSEPPLRDLLRQLRQQGEADVICLDEQDDVDSAVKALRAGALDIVDSAHAELALIRHVQRILGSSLPRSA